MPPALSASPDAMALLKALRRRWLMAGALGCLAACLAFVAAWYGVPAKFLATALLRVDSKQQTGIEQLPNQVVHQMLMKTSADRLKSKDILLKALKDDNVRNLGVIRKHPDTTTALMWMEENLKVEFRDGSELLNVLLSGEDPQDLVRIADAMTNSFLQTVNGEEKRRRQDRALQYAKMLEEARQKQREKNAEKEAIQKANGGGKSMHELLTEQAQIRFRLERAEQFLRDRTYELDRKKAELVVFEKQKADAKQQPAPEVSVKELCDVDPTLRDEMDTVSRLKKVLQVMIDGGHPKGESARKRIENQLETAKTTFDTHIRDLRAEMENKLRKKYDGDIDGAIVKLRTETGPLEGYIAKYQKDVDDLAKSVGQITLWSARLSIIESEIQQQDKAVAELFQAHNRAEVEVNGTLPLSRIGDAEWQPRDAKKRLLLLILAPLAAFFGMVLAVGWWEFSARRIQGPDELASGLAIRVVGAVPELPDPRRAIASDPQSQAIYRHNLIESIDAIRTMLLRNAPAENLRTIMVTSAVGGEGKTTLASNLAMSLARAGRKTLLVDCDLRRPAAHQLFEQTLQPGFSEVALREVELPDAVRPTTTDPNLFFLPAGHWDREVIQELAKNGITGIFEKLEQEYDFIIVDSHPVLPATDSLLIGQHVDAVIVSVMRDISQVHHVHAACQQLSTLGIRVFGAVVNGVPVKMYGKDYQYAGQAA
jgi:capsular exopolysaccharide synthesis family protein